MKQFLKEYGWVMYLGSSLSFLHITACNWRYWAIMIPMIILIAIKSKK